MDKPPLRILVLGPNESGKATLIGHLLYKCGHLSPEMMTILRKQKEEEAKTCRQLLESLRSTEDTDPAPRRRHYRTPKFEVTIADTPSRGGIAGGSFFPGGERVDCVLLLVSAGEEEFETDRHLIQKQLHLACKLQVKQIVVCVNKMDSTLVPYNRYRYEDIIGKMWDMLQALKKDPATVAVLPISALYGDNLKEPSVAMLWFKRWEIMRQAGRAVMGATLEQLLDSIPTCEPRRDPMYTHSGWTKKEEKALLSAWKSLAPQPSGDLPSPSKVSAALRQAGVWRSTEQCRCKIDILRRHYMAIILRGGIGSCPFYRELHDIMQYDASAAAFELRHFKRKPWPRSGGTPEPDLDWAGSLATPEEEEVEGEEAIPGPSGQGELLVLEEEEEEEQLAIPGPSGQGEAALPEEEELAIPGPSGQGEAALPEEEELAIPGPSGQGEAALPEEEELAIPGPSGQGEAALPEEEELAIPGPSGQGEAALPEEEGEGGVAVLPEEEGALPEPPEHREDLAGQGHDSESTESASESSPLDSLDLSAWPRGLGPLSNSGHHLHLGPSSSSGHNSPLSGLKRRQRWRDSPSPLGPPVVGRGEAEGAGGRTLLEGGKQLVVGKATCIGATPNQPPLALSPWAYLNSPSQPQPPPSAPPLRLPSQSGFSPLCLPYALPAAQFQQQLSYPSLPSSYQLQPLWGASWPPPSASTPSPFQSVPASAPFQSSRGQSLPPSPHYLPPYATVQFSAAWQAQADLQPVPSSDGPFYVLPGSEGHLAFPPPPCAQAPPGPLGPLPNTHQPLPPAQPTWPWPTSFQLPDAAGGAWAPGGNGPSLQTPSQPSWPLPSGFAQPEGPFHSPPFMVPSLSPLSPSPEPDGASAQAPPPAAAVAAPDPSDPSLPSSQAAVGPLQWVPMPRPSSLPPPTSQALQQGPESPPPRSPFTLPLLSPLPPSPGPEKTSVQAPPGNRPARQHPPPAAAAAAAAAAAGASFTPSSQAALVPLQWAPPAPASQPLQSWPESLPPSSPFTLPLLSPLSPIRVPNRAGNQASGPSPQAPPSVASSLPSDRAAQPLPGGSAPASQPRSPRPTAAQPPQSPPQHPFQSPAAMLPPISTLPPFSRLPGAPPGSRPSLQLPPAPSVWPSDPAVLPLQVISSPASPLSNLPSLQPPLATSMWPGDAAALPLQQTSGPTSLPGNPPLAAPRLPWSLPQSPFTLPSPSPPSFSSSSSP
ncbi:basic proline-rich protein-like isoform X2 [Rhineura floridana]|nr:basic proline-rich protein-like isoform X2 [Rhineura floridana]XP_061468940.1 basic proline-rich protein-like isoform X2 [Rhineura floridana]